MVVKGKRPSKPADASKLGLTSSMWKVVEECWNKKREKRPEIQNVVSRLRSKSWWVYPSWPLWLLRTNTERTLFRSKSVHASRVGYVFDSLKLMLILSVASGNRFCGTLFTPCPVAVKSVYANLFVKWARGTECGGLPYIYPMRLVGGHPAI